VAEDITLGETYRKTEANTQEIARMPERYVTRREYEKDQKNTSDRLVENAANIKATDTKVDTIQKEQAIVEKERQKEASARRWQLFLMVAGPIITALVTIYTFQGQTP
jgi:HD superfamily phosphohydrolase